MSEKWTCAGCDLQFGGTAFLCGMVTYCQACSGGRGRPIMFADDVPADEAERERDCYRCGVAVPASAVRSFDYPDSPRGWAILCRDCAGKRGEGEE